MEIFFVVEVRADAFRHNIAKIVDGFQVVNPGVYHVIQRLKPLFQLFRRFLPDILHSKRVQEIRQRDVLAFFNRVYEILRFQFPKSVKRHKVFFFEFI